MGGRGLFYCLFDCLYLKLNVLLIDLVLEIGINGLRLGEGGECTTNVHKEHTLQIYEKMLYEALNRHFCQAAVSSSFSVRINFDCIACRIFCIP